MEQHGSLLAEPRFWVAVAFVLFFGLLGKKLWVAITGLLDKRTNEVRAELAEAARLRQEAETMLRDAQAQRDAALADATALLESAKAEAARVGAAARAEAEAMAARRESMAMDRIAAAEQAATREVRDAAIEVATRAAAQLLAEAGPLQDAVLIDNAIAALPGALGGRRAA